MTYVHKNRFKKSPISLENLDSWVVMYLNKNVLQSISFEKYLDQCWEGTRYKRNGFLERVHFWKTEVEIVSFKNEGTRKMDEFFFEKREQNLQFLKMLYRN